MIVKLNSWKDCKQIYDVICSMDSALHEGNLNYTLATNEQAFFEEVMKRYEQGKKRNTIYLTALAKGLRELWPPGSKDGKYEWRSSVSTLVDRLSILWETRGYDEIPIERCLSVARRYLANYTTDTTYMQTLQYYIWKQKTVTSSPGKAKIISSSKFGDMLEGKADEDAVQNEWEQLISDASIGEGVLI